MKNNDNMSYENYLELMKQEVSKRTGKRVELQMVRKNNGLMFDGLTIISENTNISPTIYLNRYYKQFITDGIEKVAESVIALYEKNRVEQSFDISLITEFERVKPLIKMKLINYQENSDLLENVPHIKVLDLAVVFMIVLKAPEKCQLGTILIHNKYLDYWDLNEDSLYKTAKENMRNDFQTIPMNDIATAVMDDVSAEECLGEMDFDMYVLTTHHTLHGAIGMLNKELLNAFMEKHQTDKLIILPSSIHEVVLIPYEIEEDWDLKEIVREVNETELDEEEYLSNSVYVYDGNELKILE